MHWINRILRRPRRAKLEAAHAELETQEVYQHKQARSSDMWHSYSSSNFCRQDHWL